MGRYAIEPDNATKAAKARGSNLRVHFKVSSKYTNNVKLTLQENIFRSSNVYPDIDGFFKSISAARSG